MHLVRNRLYQQILTPDLQAIITERMVQAGWRMVRVCSQWVNSLLGALAGLQD